MKRFDINLDQHIDATSDSYPRRLGRWFVNLLTKYWIFISCGALLFVSIQNNVVIYRIIYMAFYLFFILSFQVYQKKRHHFLIFLVVFEKISFGFWRKTAATFHLIIIIYSMLILIGLYLCQVNRFQQEILVHFRNLLVLYG